MKLYIGSKIKQCAVIRLAITDSLTNPDMMLRLLIDTDTAYPYY